MRTVNELNETERLQVEAEILKTATDVINGFGYGSAGTEYFYRRFPCVLVENIRNQDKRDIFPRKGFLDRLADCQNQTEQM